MRLRTKLFLTSSLVVLLLWAGTLWPIQKLIWSSFDHLANSDFTGTRQELRNFQAERVQQLREDGRMLLEIPELRALIAEHNFEVSADNLNSLRERLDNLSDVMGVPFVCVCDARGAFIAQNSTSPWATLADLSDYAAQSAQAQPLIQHLYTSVSSAGHSDSGQFGLWLYHGQLFEVVGLPLVFDTDTDVTKVDGALMMAEPITGALATDLAASHSCDISFLTNDGAMASSLQPALATVLRKSYDQHLWPTATTFDTKLGGTTYRSYMEPLLDPCSGTAVGATIIQSSMGEWVILQRRIFTDLLAIMSVGLMVAAAISFMLSGAVTRPVRDLVKGVRRVADGDLNHVVANSRSDEIGELATAFNDMVAQLRVRRELERLVEESQAANRAKSQFLANMSHEIRTPLHGVIGMANLLLSTELNERQKHYAQLVRSSTEVLTTLINDILDFSKIEAGKLELETMEFDLHCVVEDVVELLYQKANTTGVEIACEIAPDVPILVNGDATRLRQILLNLIGNAIKFTEAGEIIVRVSLETAQPDAMLLRFEVTDTGIGIPPDRLVRLFKSFSQVDASTTRRFGGTGLGLVISKQLAELMGGSISVESEFGKGSKFWFTANFRNATPVEPKLHPALAGIRVLVADNNASVRRILSGLLTQAGMQPFPVTTGGEIDPLIAAADADQKNFQILLASRNVPGLSHLVETARSRKITPILLATTANDERPQVLQESGFNFALAKPVRRTLLIAALTRALGLVDYAKPELTTHSNELLLPQSNKTVRVLVAEDNEINQIVAAEFLRRMGFESLIVKDGQCAVKAFVEGQYDLVLMDCQMPVMDGFDATREIRRHEQAMESAGKLVRKVPIVALTANSSGADRDRCLQAGMNAYCGKPFREKELIETLALLLPKSENLSPPTVLPTTTTTSAKTDREPNDIVPFEINALRIRCTGNAALALTILNKFETQLSEAATQIETSLRAGNSEQVARASHALKGTAGVLAAESLRLSLAELEQHGRKQTLNLAEMCFARLQQEITRCAAYVPQARLELQANLTSNGQ